MSRKNKNFRAWEHQNPSGTPKEAWDAAWESQQGKAYSLKIESLTATLAARDAEVEGLRRELQQKELIHIGYTNAHQIAYAKDESGSFYPDTENECYIPVYMLKNHKHRAAILDAAIDALTAGEVEG